MNKDTWPAGRVVPDIAKIDVLCFRRGARPDGDVFEISEKDGWRKVTPQQRTICRNCVERRAGVVVNPEHPRVLAAGRQSRRLGNLETLDRALGDAVRERLPPGLAWDREKGRKAQAEYAEIAQE